MCGIVGAVARRDITKIVLEGLQRLEYRGYDSAGIAVVNKDNGLQRLRCVGKVGVLITAAAKMRSLSGEISIAHTRWATHGKPTENNAHPHISGHIVVVHNGIIENHESLRDELRAHGYVFVTETDSEVIAHLVNWEQRKQNNDLSEVVRRVVKALRGSYGTVIMDIRKPNSLIAARSGSPIVIGLGVGENFLASDQIALLPVTSRFMYLEEGDIAKVTCDDIQIWDKDGCIINRLKITSQIQHDIRDKGLFDHYMQKEIFEQPQVIKSTLEGRFNCGNLMLWEFDDKINKLLSRVQNIKIIACGTSYHSAMVSRCWFEELVGMPCDVEIASEFRYRKAAVRPGSLLITLSQSGETADTLAALRVTKTLGYVGSLTICNVASSSLVRESDIALITCAGIEICVASTKTFTAQLTMMLMLVAYIGRLLGMEKWIGEHIIASLQALPSSIKQIFLLEPSIKKLAKDFLNKHNALFLGRGDLYPIAMEGALKLKEISYIHAEAYAAGELKHGPLALIDSNIPVIVIAPKNRLLDKLKANIEEIRARGGVVYIFTEKDSGFTARENMNIISLPSIEESIAPIIYTIPMQMLAYHIAVVKGADIDQPRNLAKSVTVE